MRKLKENCPDQTSKRFRDHLEDLLAEDKGTFDVDVSCQRLGQGRFPCQQGRGS